MPFLNQITGYLNSRLSTTVFKGIQFQPGQYSTIAITVPSTSKESAGTEPILADDMDNNQSLAYDDRMAVQVYHKIASASHVPARRQYGASNDNMISDYRMLMIVAANRRMIRMSPEDLETYFIKGLASKIPNSEIQPLNLTRVTVMHTGTDFNTIAVWRDEYAREYDLPPNQILFRINYTIQMAYKKSCLEECCT